MKSFTLFSVLLVLTVVLSACGGGGSSVSNGSDAAVSTDPGGDTTTTATSTAKASDLTGSWTGSYTLIGAVSATTVPITFSLIGTDNTSIVTGNVYSQYVAGAFSGALDNQGIASGTVANYLDGQTWQIKLTKTSAGVTITSITQGLATTGSGSCTTKPTLAVDLTGEYPVRYKQTYPTVNATFTTGSVALSYDGSGFTGAIVGQDGLKAKIRLYKISGYWFAEINGGVMGTVCNATNTKYLLSQSSPISNNSIIAAKADGVITPAIAPLSIEMWGYTSSNGADTIQLDIFLEGSIP